MRLLNYEDYIPVAFGACQLLKDLAINKDLDPVQYIKQTMPWCGLEKLELGLYANYDGASCPRLLLGETTVVGRNTLVVAFRETKGLADWADNTKVIGSIDAFTPVNDFYSGNMHSGFRARAKLLPLGPIAERLENGWNVVFTGYSQGSAVAEAATVMLMNNICWKPQWLEQLIYLGFASPLLYDNTFSSELLVNHYKTDISERRANILHHFVYRQDIVPRALTLCGSANRFFTEKLTAWINNSTATTLILELAKLVIPDYQPCGNWHILSGNIVEHLEAHSTEGLNRLKELIFFPWKNEGKLTLEAKHFQHHGNSHYYRELSLYYKPIFDRAHNQDIRLESLAPIIPPSTFTEAWWDKGQLKVLIQGPNVLWTDKVIVNYRGREFRFEKEKIGACSYHQIVVACDMSDRPDTTVSVKVVSSLSERISIFTEIPQVLSDTTVNENLKSCSSSDLLRLASLVSLLTHPTVQNPAINTVTTLLTKVIENVPLEVIFLPLAKGDKLSEPALDFLSKSDPPPCQMLSEVGISIIRAAFQKLKKKTMNSRAFIELASDLAIVIDFISQGTNKYATMQSKRVPITDKDAAAFYEGLIVGATGSATMAHATVLACVPVIALPPRATIQPNVEEKVTQHVENLETSLEKLLSNFGRAYAHQFCGLTIGESSGASYADAVLAQKRKNIATLENEANLHRGDIDAPKSALKKTTSEIEQFGVLVDQVDAFFSEKRQTELGGDSFDIGVTATPSKWYLQAPKRVAGTIAEIVYVPIGALISGFEAAVSWSSTPFVDFYHNLVKIERWINVSPKTFSTYEEFVLWLASFLAKSEGHTIGEGVWNAEEYILSVADKPDARDAPQTRKYVWSTLSRFGDFPDHFKFGTACRMQQIACIHQLRAALSSLPLVGLFGTSNSGKTFLMKKILGNIPEVTLPAHGTGIAQKTVFPRIYSHPYQNGICILDTMGLDDPELEQSAHLLLTIPKVVVLMAHATEHTNVKTGEVLKHTANVIAGRPPNKSWLACLTILNMADELFKDDEDSFSIMKLVDEENRRPINHQFPAVIRNNPAFPRWWTCLNPLYFPGREIPNALKFHETNQPKGIHSLDDVLRWINTATQNIQQRQ